MCIYAHDTINIAIDLGENKLFCFFVAVVDVDLKLENFLRARKLGSPFTFTWNLMSTVYRV